MKENQLEKSNINKNNIINYLKNNKKTIIFFILLILFTIVTYLTFSNKMYTIDETVHSYVISTRNTLLTNILITITNISSPTTLIILSLILLIIIKKKRIPLLICLNLACSFLTNEAAKLIFSRSRPIGINLIEETGFSYPSGHSMVSMAYYGFIAYILSKNIKDKRIKSIFITIIILAILTIGFSRIYLGVHYLSDILGGFLLALIYLMIYIKIIKLEKNN